MKSRGQKSACVAFDLRSWVRSLEWLKISRKELLGETIWLAGYL